MTYGQFFQDVRQAARTLADSGLGRGGRVAVLAEKSPEVIVTYLGTAAAGGVLVPLNPAYTDAEAEYYINDARPSVLICDPERAEGLDGIAASAGVRTVLTMDRHGGGTFPALWKNTRPAEAVGRSADDTAAILYTSGTTGKPKGAVLPHGALASNAESLAGLWRFSKDDRLIHALPVHHTHGLFVAVNVALMSGCSLIFMNRFNAEETLGLMPDATAMMGIPTFYTRLLRLPGLNAETTAHMRLFISGSAPLAESTHDEWKKRTGHEILERYGMTETNMICSIPYDGPRRPGAVGRPLPGVEIRIRDFDSGEIAPQGRTGMLETRGPGLFSGYWNLPQKTREEFTDDGFFITGDIARIDPDGFTVIAGRAKDMVISGGVNLYPKEIEDAIGKAPGVAESAVIGVPHPDLGECAAAVVVTEDHAEVSAESIRRTLNGMLARFKHPKHIAFVPSLPRNAMGKVQKSVLRQDFADLFKK